MSPPVAKAKVYQQFTLAVPTEKEGATHDRDRADRARRLLDRLVRARARLERDRSPATGSGEERGDPAGDLDGGKVPTDEDAVFRFIGSIELGQDVHVPGAADLLGRHGRRLERRRELRHARADDRGESPISAAAPSSTLAIVALVVGGVGVAARRSSRWRAGAAADMSAGGRARCGRRAGGALALPAAAWAHAALLAHTSAGERHARPRRRPRCASPSASAIEPRFAVISVTDAPGTQVDGGRPAAAPGDRRHDRS